MKIAFDIDDTILSPSVATGFGQDTPNYEVIAVYKWFQAQGHEMILWSGGGIEYASVIGNRFGLQPFSTRTKEKGEDIDIAFDDCDVNLARVNIKVKRLNNSISRSEWNKHNKILEK